MEQVSIESLSAKSGLKKIIEYAADTSYPGNVRVKLTDDANLLLSQIMANTLTGYSEEFINKIREMLLYILREEINAHFYFHVLTTHVHAMLISAQMKNSRLKEERE